MLFLFIGDVFCSVHRTVSDFGAMAREGGSSNWAFLFVPNVFFDNLIEFSRSAQNSHQNARYFAEFSFGKSERQQCTVSVKVHTYTHTTSQQRNAGEPGKSFLFDRNCVRIRDFCYRILLLCIVWTRRRISEIPVDGGRMLPYFHMRWLISIAAKGFPIYSV